MTVYLDVNVLILIYLAQIQDLRSEPIYGFETGLGDSLLSWESIWNNQNYSHENKHGSNATETSCTIENFRKFYSFFMEFKKIAREYLLPPEMHRFGLISERSLLPFLDVGTTEAWSVIIQFSGCPNCSLVVHDGDAIRTILQTHHAPVKEVRFCTLIHCSFNSFLLVTRRLHCLFILLIPLLLP